MAFRNLTDADCGGTNPLLQLTSHLTTDQAFRDGFQPFTSNSDQLVEQFLQETSAIPQTFQMDGLLQEMREIESQRFAVPPIPASRVKDHLNDDTWALQYIQDGKKFEQSPNQEEVWAGMQNMGENFEHNEFGINEDWARDYLETTHEEETDTQLVQASANEFLDNVQDPKFQYSKFMKFMNKLGEGSVIIQDGQVIGDTEDDTPREWIEEYNKTIGEKEIWDKYKEEWQKLSDDKVTSEHPWVQEYSNFYDPYKEYSFIEDNPLKDTKNALEIGKQKLESGDLPSAVLCFEAAVYQEPENAEAWKLLGTTQAENEQDPNAISALKKCLQLDPNNLSAIMSLAICYTNENYQNEACHTLANWLKINPKYSQMVPDNYSYDGTVPSFLSQSQHKEVQEMFIKAVQINPQEIDYEVQCCLGVLFNLSTEYDKAVDCFKTALQVKPNDSRLWNRLGATLANGSRPEEAVDAYHHALNLSPGFIRARYNVGITCINLSAYKEAAEHFLIALNQQAQGKDISEMNSTNQMSETIWSTLRMCVGLMNKPELKEFVDRKDLKSLNNALEMTDN